MIFCEEWVVGLVEKVKEIDVKIVEFMVVWDFLKIFVENFDKSFVDVRFKEMGFWFE